MNDFPHWNFDGSSTNQAEGSDSDCILVPACIVNSPFENGYLVLCEVYNHENTPHISNSRTKLKVFLNRMQTNKIHGLDFNKNILCFKMAFL